MQAESLSQTQTLELGGLHDEVLAAKDAVGIAKKALIEATTEEADRQMEMGTIHAAFEEARQELEKLEQSVSLLSSEISDLKHAKTKLAKISDAAKLETKKLSVQIDRIRKERVTAEKEVITMLKKYSWIESEKSAFGIRGGDYDFDETNPSETSRVLKELQSEQETLVSSYVVSILN
jgi:structural maintenance of chromosome 2